MIRNVVVGRLSSSSEEASPSSEEASAVLDRALAAIQALDPPGCVSMTTGRDLGLRDGGWDFSIVADFVDAAAYHAYDLEEEHNRIRRELFAAVCSDIVRVQFALPDPA